MHGRKVKQSYGKHKTTLDRALTGVTADTKPRGIQTTLSSPHSDSAGQVDKETPQNEKSRNTKNLADKRCDINEAGGVIDRGQDVDK